jgi:hypothetical protein
MNCKRWGILNSKHINYKYVSFLLNKNNKSCYDGRAFTYIIKYNNNIRFGASNQLYNRFNQYKNIYGDNAEILALTEHKSSLNNQYNKNFIDFMMKFTNNNNVLPLKEEPTITRMYQDIKTGKYKILYQDIKKST